MLYILAYVVFAALVAVICIQDTRYHELKQKLNNQSGAPVPVQILSRIPRDSDQALVANPDNTSIPEDTTTLVESIIRRTS